MAVLEDGTIEWVSNMSTLLGLGCKVGAFWATPSIEMERRHDSGLSPDFHEPLTQEYQVEHSS